MTENERFELVFAKTGPINLGTGIANFRELNTIATLQGKCNYEIIPRIVIILKNLRNCALKVQSREMDPAKIRSIRKVLF